MFSQPIDGLSPLEWARRQPVAYTATKPGTYLYVFEISGWLRIVALTRTTNLYVPLFGEGYPPLYEERAPTNGIVHIRISDANGLVADLALDLSERDAAGLPRSDFPLDNAFEPSSFFKSRLPPGGYRIEAYGTVDGVDVVAPDSYFARVDQRRVSLANPNLTNGPISCLLLIGTNADGSISKKPFAPIPGGKFLENDGDGLAAWQPNDPGSLTLPQSVTVNGKTISLPLPFSRYTVVPNP